MSFDFKDNKPPVDYQLRALAHMEQPAQSKSSRFMTLSALVHAGLILAAGMMAAPLADKIQTETISIELEEPLRPLAQGVVTLPTQGTVAPMPEIQEDPTPISDEDVVVTKPSVAARPPPPAVIPKQKIVTEAKQELKKAASMPKPVAVAHPVQVGPPAAAKVATIDDIDAPEVDTASDEVRQSLAPTAYNENLDQDLEDINSKQEQLVAIEKNKIDQEADAVDAQNEQALEEANAKTKADLAAVEAANAARRERDSQAIANALAKEESAREAAANAAAAKRAAAIAAAAARAEAEGAGTKGLPKEGPLAGAATGVRSLDQLRQMPGNPTPQYSNRERLDHQSGQVTYHAYVKKDGTLSNFRQVSTTGFANLDAKTLTALQQWRFYPGQEGWVELPFSWDLKGGAQSVDGLLRTKRSDLSGR